MVSKVLTIGVVSDTHSFDIPKQLITDFQNVDLIIHAGDFSSLDDYKFFKNMKDVRAVYGNMDEPDLCRQLPVKELFQFGGVSIGVFHGQGPQSSVLAGVQKEFRNDKVDVVVFGHSHVPLNKKIDNVLYFNPGSPNDIVHAPYCSYGILTIKNEKVSAKIIKVK